MKTENIKSVTGRKAFGFRGPNFWNNLKEETQIIENKTTFKKHVTKAMCRGVDHPE